MPTRRFFSLLAVCLWAALPVFTQENSRVTVSVSGSDGAPIRDLKKGDFSLQEGGKPRTVGTFISPQTALVAPQLGANEYSNAPHPDEVGAIFVVLDTIHTRYVDERDMREMILKFLGRAAQAKRAVALAILSNKGLRVYHDYQTSSNVLLAALIKAGLGGMKGGTPPTGLSDTEVATEAARLTAFSKRELANLTPPEQPVRSSVDMPLLMFEDIGRAAYGLPGRKALVWVTNVVPFDIDPKNFQFVSPKTMNQGVPVAGSPQVGGNKDVLTNEEIKKILPIWRRSMRALLDGGVAVSPVEARGSYSSGGSSFTIAVMRLLAQLTGGKAFYGSNDPFPEILQLCNGNLAGYVLGFTGESNASPDFHRVQVTVNKPGVLNAPLGYFAADGTIKSRAQEDVLAAVQSSLAYTELTFSIKLTGNEDSAGKKKVNMTISLPGDAGVLEETTRSVDLGLIAVVKDATDTTVGKLNENAGGQFPPEAVAQIKELGFQLKRSVDVPVGEFTLHFVLRDNQNGRTGSLIVPLSVK